MVAIKSDKGCSLHCDIMLVIFKFIVLKYGNTTLYTPSAHLKITFFVATVGAEHSSRVVTLS